MSIFTIDQREHKQQIAIAVEQYKKNNPSNHWQEKDYATLMAEVELFRAALGLGPSFNKHCKMLVLAGNPDKILRLVAVCNDFELRRWIRWPILLVLFIPRLLIKLVQLGFGGK